MFHSDCKLVYRRMQMRLPIYMSIISALCTLLRRVILKA